VDTCIKFTCNYIGAFVSKNGGFVEQAKLKLTKWEKISIKIQEVA
jgi:hypothetical protein